MFPTVETESGEGRVFPYGVQTGMEGGGGGGVGEGDLGEAFQWDEDEDGAFR